MLNSRKFCPRCVIKHLAKAATRRQQLTEVLQKLATAKILQDEAKLGYAEHYWLGLANMSEAEDEILAESQHLAEDIRAERKQWEEDPEYWVNFLALIHSVAGATGLYPEVPSHLARSGKTEGMAATFEPSQIEFTFMDEPTRPEMWPCGGNNDDSLE